MEPGIYLIVLDSEEERVLVLQEIISIEVNEFFTGTTTSEQNPGERILSCKFLL